MGEIYFHAEFNGKLLSLMNIWDMLEYKPSKSSCLAKKQKCCPLLVGSEELACAVTYCHLKDDMYRISAHMHKGKLCRLFALVCRTTKEKLFFHRLCSAGHVVLVLNGMLLMLYGNIYQASIYIYMIERLLGSI